MPSRNAPSPCGSARKHKRCCLERRDAVSGALHARGRLMEDVIEWLGREHGQTLRRANDETVLIRMLERRWRARLAALPFDPADAALAVIEFDPDDVAEPLPDGIALRALSWSIDDHDAVLDALDDEDPWEDIGESLPSGWAFAWPAAPAADEIDLGGRTEDDGQIEVARLIVDEREVSLISANPATLTEIAARFEAGQRDLIKPSANRLAA
ncbi:MAG: hypothetical protein ABSG43_27100 [Solirubrobacteraceae bacterium]